MKNLTSMADFYSRLKQDDRYKQLAIYAYRESGWWRNDSNYPTYEQSITWIESWLANRLRECYDKNTFTCDDMVAHLNNKMICMPIFNRP